MSKQQVIEQIRALNRSAPQEFLIGFNEHALENYLKRLSLARSGRGRTSVWVRPDRQPSIVARMS